MLKHFIKGLLVLFIVSISVYALFKPKIDATQKNKYEYYYTLKIYYPDSTNEIVKTTLYSTSDKTNLKMKMNDSGLGCVYFGNTNYSVVCGIRRYEIIEKDIVEIFEQIGE
jgi:hypothetical protein